MLTRQELDPFSNAEYVDVLSRLAGASTGPLHVAAQKALSELKDAMSGKGPVSLPQARAQAIKLLQDLTSAPFEVIKPENKALKTFKK